MKKQWYQLRFSSFSSCINFRKAIINKNQIYRSDEDFQLMGDMPKEDAMLLLKQERFDNYLFI